MPFKPILHFLLGGKPLVPLLKAFFSWDVLAAAVLVTVLAALLATAYSMQSSRIAFQHSISARQADAMLLADYLLKHCPEENGLLECDGKTTYSHVLSASAVENYGEDNLQDLASFLGIKQSASLKIFTLDDVVLMQAGSAQGLCVRRLALMDGKEVVLQACVAEN